MGPGVPVRAPEPRSAQAGTEPAWGKGRGMRSGDRRRRPRLTLLAKLEASVSHQEDVRVINLGPAGAMIEHGAPLASGGIRILALRLAGVDLRLRSRIAWSRVHSASKDLFGQKTIRYRSGLHFLDLPEAAEAHLQDFLATAMRGANKDPLCVPR